MANTTITYFSATTVAATIVPANPNRRRLNVYSFSLPEETDPNSIWMNDATTTQNSSGAVQGNTAVPFHCKQIIPGATWEYGGSDDYVSPLQLRFQGCPTGAISVITSMGTHRGLIEEFS